MSEDLKIKVSLAHPSTYNISKCIFCGWPCYAGNSTGKFPFPFGKWEWGFFIFLKLFPTKYILFTTIKPMFKMVTGCDHNVFCAKDGFFKNKKFLLDFLSSFNVPFCVYVWERGPWNTKDKKTTTSWIIFSLERGLPRTWNQRSTRDHKCDPSINTFRMLFIHSFLARTKPGIVLAA